MTNLPFYIMDVFAEERYNGNQLAVVRNAEGLSTEEMQDIAQEIHFSETTFILSDDPRDDGYDVRIFTPATELPFAGHPTLGTAAVIRQEILSHAVKQINLNLQSGQIPVTFGDDGIIWMRQNSPEFGHIFDSENIADVLGLLPDDVDMRYPAQEVSTGVPFVIAPLKTLDAVRRAYIRLPKFDAMVGGAVPSPDSLRARGLLIFCPEAYEEDNDLNVRVFVHYLGIPEDPATGAANGCLAAYLVRHRYFESDQIDCRVEQGHEINRPSLLMLRAQKTGEDIEVHVGGHVIIVAQGELLR